VSRLGVASVVVAVLGAEAAAQSWPNLPAPPHPIADPWAEPEAPAQPPVTEAPPPSATPAPSPPTAAPVSLNMRKRRIVRRQRDFIEPSAIASTPPPPPAYPRAVVERPLLLPPGHNEGTVGVGVGRDSHEQFAVSFGTLTLAARAGGEAIEAFGRVQLVPVHDEPDEQAMVDVEPVQRVLGGIKARLASDTALVLQGMLSSAGKVRQVTPGVNVMHKLRSRHAALTLTGGFDVTVQWSRYNADNKLLGGFAAAVGQIQASPTLALEVSGMFAHHLAIEGDYKGDTAQTYQFGFAMIASLTQHVDLIPFVTIAVMPVSEGMLAGLAFSVH
jgi:hypothetical protein